MGPKLLVDFLPFLLQNERVVFHGRAFADQGSAAFEFLENRQEHLVIRWPFSDAQMVALAFFREVDALDVAVHGA